MAAPYRLACSALCWSALVLGACEDDGSPSDPTGMELDAQIAGDASAGAALDTSPGDARVSTVPPDLGASFDAAGPFGNGARDRCLEGTCAQPPLPAQPDFGFLSDAGDGWVRLVEAVWTLAPKSEGYRCVRKTISEDVFISAFKPLNPAGAHHTTLSVESGAGQPDGVIVCGVSAGSGRRLQGSGVGSEPTKLPSGVAMKLVAGEQLSVNLHLFNVGEQPLVGTSGVWIKRVPKAQVMQEAEVVLAGPLGLSIPPGAVKQMGSCTLRSAVTVFSVSPHMHQLGRQLKVTAHSSISGERVLHDGPYDFTHQLLYEVAPVQLAAGDRVSIECDYRNDTTRTVGWGDSSLDEMCFAGLGLYPASGASGFPCTN